MAALARVPRGSVLPVLPVLPLREIGRERERDGTDERICAPSRPSRTNRTDPRRTGLDSMCEQRPGRTRGRTAGREAGCREFPGGTQPVGGRRARRCAGGRRTGYLLCPRLHAPRPDAPNDGRTVYRRPFAGSRPTRAGSRAHGRQPRYQRPLEHGGTGRQTVIDRAEVTPGSRGEPSGNRWNPAAKVQTSVNLRSY
jgi:hypothetical protein